LNGRLRGDSVDPIVRVWFQSNLSIDPAQDSVSVWTNPTGWLSAGENVRSTPLIVCPDGSWYCYDSCGTGTLVVCANGPGVETDTTGEEVRHERTGVRIGNYKIVHAVNGESCATQTTVGVGSWYITNGICIDEGEAWVNGESTPIPPILIGKDNSGETFIFSLSPDALDIDDDGDDKELAETGIRLRTDGNEFSPWSLELWMGGENCVCISLRTDRQPKCGPPGKIW
jgi:hypothetical protein